MNRGGKSDRSEVPKKFPNNERGAPSSAEGTEGRDLAKRNPLQQTRHRTQSRARLQQALERIRQAAGRDRRLRLTTLWHHMCDIDRLREAYFDLKRTGAPGVDGVTWQQYGEQLEDNLEQLVERLQRGAYRAKPVLRGYVPKSDGRQRPIGMPTVEDKIVQHAASEVVGAVFEADFKGYSYGFRPGRSQHNALDAVRVGIKAKSVSWILDADIRGFFDTIDHGWLMKFVEHRIADQRALRLIRKWLKAGVLEDGRRIRMTTGTPQGGSISPLLANVYLHYVFDLWADAWRRRRARGNVIIVRYADDIVLGFEHHPDAVQFQADLRARLSKFNLELHPEKTRLLEFGRNAARDRASRGLGKPETFNFLGFTHSCSVTRAGRFQVLRRTMRTRMRAKLRAIKLELRQRLHWPIPEVGKWLAAVLEGHYRYYGVPDNRHPLVTFRFQVLRQWRRALQRRSQRGGFTWTRMAQLADHWLPVPRTYHLYPEQRLRVITQGKSPVR